MLVNLLKIIILFSEVVAQEAPTGAVICKRSTDAFCDEWGPCSCDGIRSRACGCITTDFIQTEHCDKTCKHGRLDSSGCVCPEWRYGACCEGCRHIHIDHCVDGKQACRESPDSIQCTQCYDPYYPAGYGIGCKECGAISHCIKRNCTAPSNTKCQECENNNVFFKLTTSNTKCERLCSFNNHTCWPGHCSEGFAKNCACTKGFRLVLTETETSCQPTQTPEIETCNTVAIGLSGEKRMANSSNSSKACKYLKDIYGNYQLKQFSAEMVSSFLLDVSAVTKPIFIREEHFGITDTIIYIEKKLINGVNTRLSAHHQLNDTSDSTKANKSYKSRGNFSVNHNLTNGEALCVVFEAYGGGYLKHVNTIPEPDKVSSPVPYQKSKGSKEICYRFDSAKPEHCLALSSCHKEPISLNSRVTRSQISTVSFDGWLDPTPVGGKNVQASGIESYEVTVNEVLQANESLMVDMEHVFNKKINESASVLSFSLKLPSDMPRLYSITLEVKDFADNTRQARRFLLYDNTSFIESWPEKHFRVTSASKQSNFTWQNHHHNICLSWNDYFQNRFYMENKLLNPIEPGPFGQISGVYEQLSGTLAVSGTPNVYGIIKFLFSSSLNGGKFSAETEVPNFLNQSYCNDFKVKDGQTYTLQVRPIDIANNSFSENRTVHVDRSVPHINNIWLIKDGYHTLFVHHMTELSTMQLYFEALDPHSGIRNVECTFGITDLGTELTKGAIGIKTIPDPSCPKNILECYCPDVGKCEFFNYTIPLNKLIEINKHKGNHNRNYYFTVKITNHAFLTNKERVDILVDESPPEPGVIYEGPKESKDIDYISDNSFMAHWHGFVDHESGIKSYRIGLAQRCLGQLELYNFTTVPVNMFYAEVPFTETSIRIPANFTGKRYVSIIALNNAMEPSKSVCSDGVSRDLSPPQLRNVTLEHASWSERVICHNGEAWHFLSSLSKVRLPDTSSCVKLCAQNSSGSKNNEISEMLPTKVVTKRDRDTSEFMCRNLQTFSKDTVVYLPNDHIDLRWDIDENVSQLEDFYVGIGTHPSEVNLPSIYGYQSTARRKTFSHYHKGISSNDLFYIFIKVVNKAGLEKISILGPILIDETPPLKQRLPEIIVTDDEIVIGWENDTFYDMEQSEQISSMFFQFGHDGNVVTPLLHWQLHVSEPCPRFSGGCLKYPLTRLQSFDTDLGFLFYADVYVYNNAGHALKVTTDTFRLPSRYPPGHAIVYDVDPELEGNLDDTDIHFTPETMCFRSSGFKHHQSISIEIGVSSGNMSDDIVPLTATNVSNTYCLNSTNITFDTTYYAIVRASCSGGVTTSFSNGVKILSEDYLIKNIKVELGQDCSKRSSSLLVPSIQNSSSEITFTFSVSVGMPYIVNVPFNNTFVLSTNDGILANDSRKGRHLSFISFNENPTITISSWSKEYTNTDIHLCLFTEYQNNKRKSVHWYYQGINSSFGLTYEYAFISYVDNFLNNSVKYIIPFIKKENGLTTSISGVDLEMNETYKWAVRQCSKVRCLQPVYSMAFHVDKIKPVGNILTSIMDVTNDAGCSKVTLEWVPFQGGSKIKFYQWVISKDANANLLLTPWKTIIAKDSRLHKVSSCVVLPVYHYSTMFMCVRAFAESGNWGHVCEILSFRSLGRNARNPVYEFDVHSDIWETVLQVLSSSNLGKIYTDFHDNELNFGTTSTKAAGVILYANERNVTWYLMLSKLVPDNCDQSKDCETSKITSSGYVVFSQDSIKPNTIYYICAFSNVTVFEREYFSETMDEINSCSNGFVVDTVAPKVGKVYVHSKEGYLTNFEGIEVIWDGFIENVDAVQLGYVDRIKRYSFAIGSRPKQDDIRNYTDVSLVKRIVLNDIKVTDGSVIYFSVKAEDHAGLTCIAVSKQYITDTTPPVLGTISNTRDDIYQSTESYITSNTVTVSVDGFRDDESGIDFFEIGVGTRPYFSDVILFSRYDENNVVLHIGDTDLIDGHTYYLIARAVNHAGLTSPLAQMKMTVDRSPPTGGHVMEGHWALKNGTDYQSDVSRIHGHWKGFDDVHSGILYYRVGLGTQQYHDDIEPMVDVGLTEDLTWNDHFYVGQKYYITVEACNGAGLCQTRSSNGIVLDNSPPIRGLVRIGSNLLHQKYQAHLSSVHVHWAGFEDPQSGIDHYTMCVGEKKGKCNIFPEFSCLLHTNIIKTGLNLPQRTDLFATVTAYNKVGMNVSKTSDAFRVDATAPVLMIKPTFHLVDGIMGQWEKSVLRIYWNFNDQESPIVSHDVSLFTHHEGHTPVEQLHLGPENKLTINLNGKEWLHDGDRYIALVTSCNQAGLCTSASSDDLLIDSTPPHSGGFKQPMLWANLNDSQANSKSKVTLTWYGFFDQESGIRNYFLTVSRSYSGNELTDGVITFLPEKNKSEHVHYLYLRDVIHGNDLLFLTIWAENNVGLNSSVARVSVNALPSSKSVNVYEMKGSMELEKHSCDIHFCNKDCTCAVVGKPCVEVSTNKSCKEVNGKLEESGYPSYKVLGGLNEIPSYISASSACLSGRWNIQEQDNSSFAVKRFEWSAGIVDQPIGEGVYNLKLENPWQDIGVRNRFVHCLSTNKSLLHSHEYVIYVRAWYSFDKYAVFESDPIMIDQTAPAVSRGRAVLDSNEMCTSDFDIIDWMATITACWNGVFNEQQGRITYYNVYLGTMPLADDIFTGTNVGLATNITLSNITLSHGTKYFFSVSAYNNIGLHTTSTSDGFIIDMENPTTGIVFNSLDHKDKLFQSSISSFSLSWHGFQDDSSGIRNYYAAIVDEPYQYWHVVNFTNVGLKTKFTFKNIQLKHGKTYYGLVEARDNIGHVSNIAISKGVTIDTTPPKQYACQRYTLKMQANGHIQSNDDNIVGLRVNLTLNSLYKISGNLTNTSIYQPRLILHIDRFHIILPLALSHNGVYSFEYTFLALYSSIYNVTVEAYNIKEASVALALSDCDKLIEDGKAPIEVRQISPKDVSVSVVILDKESPIHKVSLGAGTNPGGFQIKALSPIHHRNNHGLIFTDVPHGSSVYVTVIAENQAGLRAIFKAEPITIDHTAPVITNLHGSIESLQKTVSGQIEYFTFIRAQWRVSDKESGIKFCFCSIGHEPDMHDVQETWHSQTDKSCESEMLVLQHGEFVYLNVECVNTVEVSTKTSTSLVACYAEPTADSTTLQFIPVNEESSMYTSTVKDNLSVQSNKSYLQLKWNGFNDPSGILSFQYRIFKEHRPFIDWTMTNRQMITMEKTDLTDGHYMAEVRAINIGNRSSEIAKAKLIVVGKPPELTGRSIVISRQANALHLDWREVFRTEQDVPLSYSVMIGTRPGYTDILDLSYTKAHSFDLIIPESTIITPNLKELCIRVICVYATGLRNEYATTFVIE